ncbi:MAG TPA: hypothetical protein DCS97_14745 [Planctomycetes bacterium]|nr:hypothetical protein [Planctomycetota bacterium]
MHRSLLILLLAIGLHAGDAAPDPDVAALTTVLLKAGAAVETATKGEVVAFLATRPTVEADEALTAQSAYLARMTMKAVLRAGVRGFDGEAGHPVQTKYAKGKLAAGPLFAAEDLAFWQKKQARYLLQSTLTPAKERVRLRWQILDLQKGKPMPPIDFPPLSAATVATAPDLGILPDYNTELLLLAGGKIGEQVGRGECWDLPGVWLQEHGYVRPGYDFGQEVPVTEALPGDVLSIDTNGFHHVMLLVKLASGLNGARIYHQNVNGKRVVILDTFPPPMLNGVKIWRPGKKAG